MTKKTKAFGYVRVSGKGQIDGDGFDRQELAITLYARRNHIEIVQVYREQGVSGTTDLDNRPALQELIEALHANGVKTVVIERLDRLARDLMIQEAIVADFQRNGFQIVSVAEPDLCSKDPTRVLIRQVMGAFAQYEKSIIVAKLRGARERIKAKTGRCEGRKPYGARPGEADVIRRMQQMRASRMSYQAIADTLQAEHVPTRQGGKWNPIVVNRILRAAERDV